MKKSKENTYKASNFKNKQIVSAIAVKDGCKSNKADIELVITEIINAFTPNNDGINDIFMPDVDLTIFNRWGQILYTGFTGWDGTYNGKQVSAGTYFYSITQKHENNTETYIKGYITLIR
ncbi:MAG: gliding motility-associated C-terminal domain-containing protein [Bacteroidales bacterium]